VYSLAEKRFSIICSSKRFQIYCLDLSCVLRHVKGPEMRPSKDIVSCFSAWDRSSSSGLKRNHPMANISSSIGLIYYRITSFVQFHLKFLNTADRFLVQGNNNSILHVGHVRNYNNTISCNSYRESCVKWMYPHIGRFHFVEHCTQLVQRSNQSVFLLIHIRVCVSSTGEFSNIYLFIK